MIAPLPGGADVGDVRLEPVQFQDGRVGADDRVEGDLCPRLVPRDGLVLVDGADDVAATLMSPAVARPPPRRRPGPGAPPRRDTRVSRSGGRPGRRPPARRADHPAFTPARYTGMSGAAAAAPRPWGAGAPGRSGRRGRCRCSSMAQKRRSSGTSSSTRTAGASGSTPCQSRCIVRVPRAEAEDQAAAGELVDVAGLGGEDQRGAPHRVGDRAADRGLGGALRHDGERHRCRPFVELRRPHRREAGLLARRLTEATVARSPPRRTIPGRCDGWATSGLRPAPGRSPPRAGTGSRRPPRPCEARTRRPARCRRSPTPPARQA